MPMNPRLLRPLATRGLDADARTYIAAVEAADGETLEQGVKTAINDFVTGCKSDGIWDSIKASCILAGARTLAGALTPLKGTAPTNNGPFVSGDYNRETGLVGNGSTKYLDSNRNNDADPQDDQHVAVFGTTFSLSSVQSLLGVGFSEAGSTQLLSTTAGNIRSRSRRSTTNDTTGAVSASTLAGISRATGATYTVRVGGATETVSLASETPFAGNLWCFARNSATPSPSSSRLAFYSIGEALDLAALDTRVSALITAIGAAI